MRPNLRLYSTSHDFRSVFFSLFFFLFFFRRGKAPLKWSRWLAFGFKSVLHGLKVQERNQQVAAVVSSSCISEPTSILFHVWLSQSWCYSCCTTLAIECRIQTETCMLDRTGWCSCNGDLHPRGAFRISAVALAPPDCGIYRFPQALQAVRDSTVTKTPPLPSEFLPVCYPSWHSTLYGREIPTAS